MFTLLLIIWSQALPYCFRFWKVGVVIIMILRASVLIANEEPENNFYTRFYINVVKILAEVVVGEGPRFPFFCGVSSLMCGGSGGFSLACGGIN